MKTPVVLFIFKRSETLEAIIGRIKGYAPSKIYIIADGPRSKEEKVVTDRTRLLALSLIDWDCEIVKKFSDDNIGVYKNIGEGALWVFEREEQAIFLEDDNLPEQTFFEYSDTLLERYKDNAQILWICGTNYLGDTRHIAESSYYYTKQLLPCGWSSWSEKFMKNYDGELITLNEETTQKMKDTYLDKRLFLQELQTVKQTRYNFLRNPGSISWDRQMVFSVRSRGKFGIAPCVNQIKNIGADEHSIHGGTSINKVMTARFCEIPTKPIIFPLISPKGLAINKIFEASIEKIILYPLPGRLLRYVGRVIKKIIRIDPDDSLVLILKNLKK